MIKDWPYQTASSPQESIRYTGFIIWTAHRMERITLFVMLLLPSIGLADTSGPHRQDPLRVIQRIMTVHPDVKITSTQIFNAELAARHLERLGRSSRRPVTNGVLLKASVPGTSVNSIVRFRDALRQHPTLKHLFPIQTVEVSWHICGGVCFLEHDDYEIDFEVWLFGATQ